MRVIEGTGIQARIRLDTPDSLTHSIYTKFGASPMLRHLMKDTGDPLTAKWVQLALRLLFE